MNTMEERPYKVSRTLNNVPSAILFIFYFILSFANGEIVVESSDVNGGITPSSRSLNPGSSTIVPTKNGVKITEKIEFVTHPQESQPINDVEKKENYAVKTSNDDWFYNPDDAGETADALLDKEEDKELAPVEEKKSIVQENGNDEDDDDEDDEDDDDNYDFWSKLHDFEKEKIEEDTTEENDGDKLDRDFDEKLMEDVIEEDIVKKNKPPTAPSKMVLFYTWMILAILIMVIVISTYQTRCKGLHSVGFRHQGREERKRLVDHEYA